MSFSHLAIPSILEQKKPLPETKILPLEIKPFRYFPTQVSPEDLKPNGMLQTNEEIQRIQAKINQLIAADIEKIIKEAGNKSSEEISAQIKKAKIRKFRKSELGDDQHLGAEYAAISSGRPDEFFTVYKGKNAFAKKVEKLKEPLIELNHKLEHYKNKIQKLIMDNIEQIKLNAGDKNPEEIAAAIAQTKARKFSKSELREQRQSSNENISTITNVMDKGISLNDIETLLFQAKLTEMFAADSYTPFILGEGGFGTVKLAVSSKTGKWYAVKMIDAAKVTKNHTQEYNILKMLKLNHLKFTRTSPSKEIKQEVQLMELAPGEALDNFLCYKFRNYYALELVIGMLKQLHKLHFHQPSIIHCDIKLSNFHFDPLTGQINLIDFGSAQTEIQNTNEAIDEIPTTPGFTGPEVIFEHLLDYKNDIYALGTSIAFLLWFIRQNEEDAEYLPPNYSEKSKMIFKKIHGYQLKTHPEELKITRIQDVELNQQVLNFLHRMRDAYPTKRPLINECLEFFIDIQNKIMARNVFQICIVDSAIFFQEDQEKLKALQDYLDITQPHNKQTEAVFFDSHGTISELEYSRLMRKLYKNYVNFNRNLFYQPGASEKELTSQIMAHLNQHDPRTLKFVRFDLKDCKPYPLEAAKSQYKIAEQLAKKFAVNPACEQPILTSKSKRRASV